MTETKRASGAVGVFSEKVAGGLAYLTFIPAIVFLLLEPYNKNYFVRYHSIQCLLFWLAMVVAGLAVKVLGLAMAFIPLLGPLLVVLISACVGIAAFLLWLVLTVKALQGEMFKLPGLGDIAERNADAT
jgi:uncharacterized membrane protein